MTFITDNKDVILIALAAIGLFMTLRTFSFNLQQRKIENTFKTLEFMRQHIKAEQIKTFIEVFHANNPLGVPKLEFHYSDGRKEHLDDFFSEGGRGNGDIHNMIEIFNLVSINLLKKELKEELIWYEYGQIMNKCYEWTHYLETEGPGRQFYNKGIAHSKDDSWIERIKTKRFLRAYIDPKLSFSYHFNRYMKNASKRNSRTPTKFYTYVE